MNKEEYVKMLYHAVKKDGIQFCLDALQEECAELIQAISHYRRKRCSHEDVIREMADVKLMVDMVKLGMTGKPFFDYFIEAKAREIGFKIQWKGDDNGEGRP